MKFYVIWSDGRKFGPADIDTLNQWIKEGRVNRDTQVENAETGLVGRARDVMGLVFQAPAPDLGGEDTLIKGGDIDRPQQRPVDIPGQPRPYIAGEPQQASPYDPLKPQQPAQPKSSPYASAPQPASAQPRDAGYNRHLDDGSQKLITTSWVLTIVSFVLCGCLLVSPFAVYNANRAKNMGNPNAQAPLIAAWIVLGLEILGWGTYAALVGLAIAQGGTWTPPGQ